MEWLIWTYQVGLNSCSWSDPPFWSTFVDWDQTCLYFLAKIWSRQKDVQSKTGYLLSQVESSIFVVAGGGPDLWSKLRHRWWSHIHTQVKSNLLPILFSTFSSLQLICFVDISNLQLLILSGGRGCHWCRSHQQRAKVRKSLHSTFRWRIKKSPTASKSKKIFSILGRGVGGY